MHFQLPKPLHGWRQFFGEVGIIVICVLIALGAGKQAPSTLSRIMAVPSANPSHRHGNRLAPCPEWLCTGSVRSARSRTPA